MGLQSVFMYDLNVNIKCQVIMKEKSLGRNGAGS